jgi:hypothetical protein
VTDEPITHIVVTPPRGLALIQLSPPDNNDLAYFQIRDGESCLGYVIATEQVGEAISKAIRGFVTPDFVDHNYTVNVGEGGGTDTVRVDEAASGFKSPAPSPTSQPRTLEDRLEQCGYDPLREERIIRRLSEISTATMDARRAGMQKAIADEWREVFHRAVADGIPLRGESQQEQAS